MYILKIIHTCKTTGYDLITGQILKQLPRKTTALLTLLFNRTYTHSILFPRYMEVRRNNYDS